MRLCGSLVALTVFAGTVMAEAPTQSPRPMPRPVAVVTAQPAATSPALAPSAIAQPPAAISRIRPMPRPVAIVVAQPAAAAPAAAPSAIARPSAPGLASVRPMPRPAGLAAPAQQVVVATASAAAAPAPKKGLFGFLRPAKRPNGLEEQHLASAAAIKVTPGKQGVVSKRGAVCGDPSIKGATLAPITSRVKGCGVPDPVQVTSVAGVRLSQPATMDCDTARALKRWVDKGVVPAFGKGKVVELKVAGHYVCRTRNHRKGAKISEHGRGRAIDISGFTLSNGKTVTVARNFDKTMRKAHKAACGIFGTTLGPGSDGMHEDHLHFDTAKHRSGAYCR